MGLWSGDWERTPDPLEPAPVPAPPPAAPPPPGRRGVVVVAAVAILVVAGLAALLAGHHRHQAVAAAAPGHPDALGLVLAAAPGGGVLVRSVTPTSPVSAVGVAPGQDLVSINGQRVTSPAQADGIIGRLRLGTAVTMQLTSGPAHITAQLQEPGVP